jgi:hypothetical protein
VESSDRARWFLIPFLPLMVIGWILAAFIATLRWIWRDRSEKPNSSGDTIRVTIRS